MRNDVLFFRPQAVLNALKFTIDTNLGTGASMIVPVQGTGNNFSIDWGDGVLETGKTTTSSHTYIVGGVYQIKIEGIFKGFNFNSGGDRLKLKSIDNWGNVGYQTSQSNAFRGCANLDFIADDVVWMNTITICQDMFFQTKLTSLPSGLTLNSVVNAQGMFYQVPLTSLPSGFTVNSLTNGSNMFYQTKLTSLPSGLLFPVLNISVEMFRLVPLTTLPSGLTLGNLVNGQGMFRQSSLTTLPSGLTLGNLVNGQDMFNATNIQKQSYSQLLININANNVNTGATFHGGNAKYNTAGQTARNALTSRSPAWNITDGGFEA